MTEWDEEFLHKEVQAFIAFSPKGTGESQFGYVRGQMDCRVTEKDGKPAIEFTWEGFDETDPVSGYGWAVFENDSLKGVLAFDDGDESVSRLSVQIRNQPESGSDRPCRIGSTNSSSASLPSSRGIFASSR